jgi:hypothetical protein
MKTKKCWLVSDIKYDELNFLFFSQQFATPDQKNNISQIDGPTPKNSFGFQISQQNFQDAKALHEVQKYCHMS